MFGGHHFIIIIIIKYPKLLIFYRKFNKSIISNKLLYL